MVSMGEESTHNLTGSSASSPLTSLQLRWSFKAVVSSQGSTGEGSAPKLILRFLTGFTSSTDVGLRASVSCWSLVDGGSQLLVMSISSACFIRTSSGEEEPGRERLRELAMEVTVFFNLIMEVTF